MGACARETSIGYLLNDNTMKGALLYEGAECIGYAYVSETGHVGPVAVSQAEEMNRAFRTALELAAASGAAQISALPRLSTNEAIGIAVAHRMRITFPMVATAVDYPK